MSDERERIVMLQKYIDANNNLQELIDAAKRDRAEWNKAIDAARKRVSRCYAELASGRYQPELFDGK